jgi:hypothetical protein
MLDQLLGQLFASDDGACQAGALALEAMEYCILPLEFDTSQLLNSRY